ncbi:predicted protein [Streptomyces sp. C]|nr:predicted protein [Streptomyces sp. C]
MTLSELGRRIEVLRENRDVTQAMVVAWLHERGIKTDTSALSRIEGGKRRAVPRELIEALLEYYQADDQTARQILDLLTTGTASPGRRRRPGLWRRHAELLGPMNFQGYLEQEPQASTLRNYEPELVPGLLQSERYALHAISTMRPELKPADVRGLLEVRLDRQRKIADGPLHMFQALIEEGALGRTVGDRSVMREQLEHLLRAEENPRTSIRILPRNVGCHPGLAGAFMLMSFPQANRDVAWVETMNRSLYFEKEGEVDRYTEVFTGLWERALDPVATRTLLKDMIKELQK